ncbi:hypothetical protein AB9F39_36735, partial [Rhizobium leguminosarum]
RPAATRPRSERFRRCAALKVAARMVISGGRIVACNGSMQVAVQQIDKAPLVNSVKLPALTENDFRIPAKGERVRVATIDRPRFTQWG